MEIVNITLVEFVQVASYGFIKGYTTNNCMGVKRLCFEKPWFYYVAQKTAL